MSTLLLSKKDMADLLNLAEVMDVVEQAFRELAFDSVQMPAKVYIWRRKISGLCPVSCRVLWA